MFSNVVKDVNKLDNISRTRGNVEHVHERLFVGRLFFEFLINHTIHKTQTIIETVQARLQDFTNVAAQFYRTSLRQKGFWTYFCPSEPPIGNRLRREVHAFSDSVQRVGNNNVIANQTLATKLSEERDPTQVRYDRQTSATPLAHIFRPHSDPNQLRNSNIIGISGTV